MKLNLSEKKQHSSDFSASFSSEARAFFQQAKQQGRVSSAYLLVGASGIGKQALAEDCAAGALCPSSGLEGCACASCRRVRSRQHPDVLWLGEDRDERTLKVELVRDAAHWLAFKPFEASRKVMVVVEAERFSTEAQNALLKTLEEPPGDSLIFFTAIQPLKLLPTILSRMQVIRVRPLASSEMKQRLQTEVSSDEMGALLYGSRGSLQAAREMIAAGYLKLRQEALQAFFTRKLPELLKAFDKKSDEKGQEKLSSLISIYLLLIRDLFLVKSQDRAKGFINEDFLSQIWDLGRQLRIDDIATAYAEVRKLKDYEKSYVSSKMIASTLLVILERLSRASQAGML